jgi:hypothetical protein
MSFPVAGQYVYEGFLIGKQSAQEKKKTFEDKINEEAR